MIYTYYKQTLSSKPAIIPVSSKPTLWSKPAIIYVSSKESRA